MSAGTGQWPSFAGLGGQVHLVQTGESLAWDRFERAVRHGTGPEIRAAREHLIKVSR